MSTCAMPAELYGKIGALARHVRRAQALRGASVTALGGVALLAVGFSADGLLDLAPVALAWSLAGALGIVGLVFVRQVMIPLLRPLDVRGLAALVEQQYPELAERLTTAVELAQGADVGHGSATLIAFLQEDTAVQASELDFLKAYPARSSRLRAGAALGVLALTAGLAVAWDRLGDFGERFATAWQMRPPFAIEVEHAPFVAKGRSWTVSARLVAGHSSRRVPAECWLVIHEGDTIRRQRMQSQNAGRFSTTVAEVPDSFAFHIEAGPVVSEDRSVTAILPVDLVAGSPTLTIEPPLYVNKNVQPTRVLHGVQDASALAYSVMGLDFRLTRAATTATLHIRRVKAEATDPSGSARLPLDLAAQRNRARLALPTLEPGVYALRLTMEAERGIATERDLGNLTIQADAPPRFTETPATFAGADVIAAPDDVLVLPVAAEDDVGLDRVDLEYRINGGPAQVEAILRGAGKRQLRRDYRFHLSGHKLKDGDTFEFRLKAVDNRQVARGAFRDWQGGALPRADLAPQVVHEPMLEAGKDRWLAVQIRAQTTPLHEKQILARRDALQKHIDEIQKRLAAERGRVKELRPDIRKYPTITPEQANQLTAIRALNLAVQNALQRLAEEAGKGPGMGGLEGLVRDVLAAQVQPADDVFQKSQDPHLAPDRREPLIEQADQHLATAQKRLQKLAQRNEQLAHDRLDHLRMETLAKRQELLARRADKLRGQDPSAQAELADLRAKQTKLREELARLALKSRLFREALEAVGPPSADHSAERLMKLAQAQRELANKLHDGSSAAETTKAMARQKEEIERTLQELTRRAKDAESDKARDLAMHALAAAEKAQRAMKQAETDAAKGNAASAQRATEDAAKMLRQASKKADELALQLTMERKAADPDLHKIGAALKDSKSEIERAEMRLGQEQPEPSARAMKRAAQAMQRSADLVEQRLTRARRGKRPIAGNTPGAPSPAMPLLTGELAKELEKHAGHPWGALPGELRTRIVNDLRIRYGEDFSHIIQGYFEALSDHKD